MKKIKIFMFKKIQKSRKGSALLIGLTVTVLLSILVTGFLEKSLRLGANAKSIEHSVQAYYLATSEIEKKLQDLWPDLKHHPWKIVPTARVADSFFGAELSVMIGSRTVPVPGYGNSPFNDDYNIISLNEPVQLAIPDGINWADVKLTVKSPILENITTADMIFWTLGNNTRVMQADPASQGLISGSEFWNEISMLARSGIIRNENTSTPLDIWDFYQNHLGSCSDYSCVLKLSLLKPVISASGKNIPFLEYKITFNKTIPNQYIVADATGYVGNYARVRRVFIPQFFTDTALDFAVLQ